MTAAINNKKYRDYHLWQDLKSGDGSAFDRVFRENYTPLYNYGLKVSRDEAIAEDCIQELFIRIWEKRSNLSDINTIKPYLFKSYRRTLINHLQFQQQQDTIDNLSEANIGISFSIEDFMIQEQTQDNLSNKLLVYLNQLPERQKEVVFLKYYGGFNHTEIAEIMRVNKQSVANLLHRAFTALKKITNGVGFIALKALLSALS